MLSGLAHRRTEATQGVTRRKGRTPFLGSAKQSAVSTPLLALEHLPSTPHTTTRPPARERFCLIPPAPATRPLARRRSFPTSAAQTRLAQATRPSALPRFCLIPLATATRPLEGRRSNPTTMGRATRPLARRRSFPTSAARTRRMAPATRPLARGRSVTTLRQEVLPLALMRSLRTPPARATRPLARRRSNRTPRAAPTRPLAPGR